MLIVGYTTIVLSKVECESYCDEIKDFGAPKVGIVVLDNGKRCSRKVKDK